MADQTENYLNISSTKLKPLAKVWYHFPLHKLSPTSHMEIVEKESLVLLHCILKGKKINVGEIIQKDISACAMRTKGKLIFPCLTIKLLQKSEIDYHGGEGLEKNLGAIDKACIQIFYSAKAAEACTSKVHHENISEQQDRSEMQEHKLDALSTMLQQHV